MLKAMKSQLSLLAIENGEAFASHIRKRVKRGPSQLAVSKSLNLIMIMPDLIAHVRDASEDRSLPAHVRQLNQFLLVYFYHPVDFLPDTATGLFGYLDDAYFAAKVYQKIRALTLRKPSDAAHELTRDLAEGIDIVRKVIPRESRKIDALVEELVRGKREAYEKLMNRKKP